jgi:ribonuclease P protein component
VLSSQHRINRGEDFRRILRSGVKDHSALGTVALAPSSSEIFRCGVITSKAVGNAVVRNRVRRRVRAACAAHAESLSGWDVVIRCGEQSGPLSFHDISSIIQRALERASRS